MTRTLFMALALGALTVSLPAAQDEGVLAPIVRTEQAGAGVVHVVYTLRGTAGTVFAVALEASTDGGRTFTVHPRAVTGDVGPGVSTGSEKTIVWDSTKDIEDLQIDRYVFRVIVSRAGVATAAHASPAAAPARGGSSGAPGAAPGRGGAAASAPKSGGLSKGAIIGITGGVAAAGVGVAVSKGKSAAGTTPAPSPSTPTTPQTRSFTGTYSVPMSVVVTNPDGSNPCNHAVVFAGNLTLALDVIAASVTGSATFQGTMVNGATTCNSQGIPSPTPGASSNTIVGSIAVTGSPSSLSFNRQVVSQGTTVSGAPATLTLTFSFGGVLNADTVSGSLTITYRDDTGTGATARIGLATGTVTVTLR